MMIIQMKKIFNFSGIVLFVFLINMHSLFTMEYLTEKTHRNNLTVSSEQLTLQTPPLLAQPQSSQFRLASRDELDTYFEAHPARHIYDEVLNLNMQGPEKKQQVIDLLTQLAHSQNPHPFAQFSMGNIKLEEGNNNEAEMYWTMCPYPFAKDFLVQLYLENGNKEEALKVLRQAAQPYSIPVNLYNALGRLVFAETKIYFHQPAIALLNKLESEELTQDPPLPYARFKQEEATFDNNDQQGFTSLKDRAFTGDKDAFKQLVLSAQTEESTDETALSNIKLVLQEGRFSLDNDLYHELNKLAKKRRDNEFRAILGRNLLVSGQEVTHADSLAASHLKQCERSVNSWYLALAYFRNKSYQKGINAINAFLWPYPESKVIIQQNLQFLEEIFKTHPTAAFVLYRIYENGIEGKIAANKQKAMGFLDSAADQGFEKAILEREKNKKIPRPQILYDLLKKIEHKINTITRRDTLSKISQEAQELLEKLSHDNLEAGYYMFRQKVDESDIEKALSHFVRAESLVTKENTREAKKTGALNELQQVSKTSMSALKALADFYYKRACSGNCRMPAQATKSYQELLERSSKSSSQSNNLSLGALTRLESCARELYDATAFSLLLRIYLQGSHGIQPSSEKLMSLVECISDQEIKDKCLQTFVDFAQANDNQEFRLAVGNQLLARPEEKWQKQGEQLIGKLGENDKEEKSLFKLEQWSKKKDYEKFIKSFEEILAQESPQRLVSRGKELLEELAQKNMETALYLATLYERGIPGCLQADKAKAFATFQKYATHNYLAALHCGQMCLYAEGVPQDDDQALDFFKKAWNNIEHSDENSLKIMQKYLSQLYERGNLPATCLLFRILAESNESVQDRALGLLGQAVKLLSDSPKSLFTIMNEEEAFSALEYLSKTDVSAKSILGLIFYEHAKKSKDEKEEIKYLLKCEPLIQEALLQKDTLKVEGNLEILENHLCIIRKTLANHFMACRQLEKSEKYVDELYRRGQKKQSYYLGRLFLACEDNEELQRKGYEYLWKAADSEVDALLTLADSLRCKPELSQKCNICKDKVVNLLRQERECSINDRLFIQHCLQKLEDKGGTSSLDGNLASELSAAIKNEDPEAYYSLGLAYYLNLQYEQAFEKFQKAAESKHRYAIARMGIMYQVGSGVEASPEKALECFEKFLSDPEYDPTEENSFEQLQISTAIIDSLTIMQGRPKALELLVFNKINLFEKTRNFEFLNEGLLLFEKAVEKNARESNEQTQKALKAFLPISKKFEQYNDEIATVPFTFAACYISASEKQVEIFDIPYNKKGYMYQALELLEKAKEMTVSSQAKGVDKEFFETLNDLLQSTIVTCAYYRLEDNKPYVVINFFEDMIKKYPEFQILPTQLAQFYLTGQAGCIGHEAKKKAFDILETHAKKDNLLAAKELAQLYKGGTLKCGVTLSECTKKRLQYLEIVAPRDVEANIELGNLWKTQVKKSDLKKAESYYKKAKELGSTEGGKKLAQLYFEQGRYSDAAEILNETCLEKDPQALILKAGIFAKCKEEIAVEKTLEYFERALDCLEEKMDYNALSEFTKVGLISHFSLLQEHEAYCKQTKWLLARYYSCAIDMVGSVNNPATRQAYDAAIKYLIQTLKCDDEVLQQKAKFLKSLLAFNKDSTINSVQRCVDELCQLIEPLEYRGNWDPFIWHCIKKINAKLGLLMLNNTLCQEDRQLYRQQFEFLSKKIEQKGFDMHITVGLQAAKEVSNNNN